MKTKLKEKNDFRKVHLGYNILYDKILWHVVGTNYILTSHNSWGKTPDSSWRKQLQKRPVQQHYQ